MTHQPITAERLVALRACHYQVKLFRDLFPNGAPLTVEAAIAVADKFNWDWAARTLLSATGLQVYDEAMATAMKVYDEAMEPAMKALYEAMEPAMKVYYEAMEPAMKALYEARATAFARAYLNDKEEEHHA